MSPDVLAALEAATEGSRELDAAIAISLGRTVEWHIDRGRPVPSGDQKPWPMLPFQLTSWGGEAVPAYTTSLDAALTLVPNGKLWRVGTGDVYFAVAGLSAGKSMWSPALALCIAALRARAALRSQPPEPDHG